MAKRAKMKTRLTKRQMQEVIVDEAYEISPWTKKKIREVVQRANVDYPESKDALFQRLFLAYGEKRARTRTRIGRLLKKLVEFDGVDATHVTESIKSQIYPVPLGIVIIKGDAICKSYFDGDAEAASTSCMTGSYHDHDEYYARLVELYAVNPDKISLVLAHNNSRIARAILWEHSDKGDLSFLDRIYSHDQGCTNALFEWAKNNVDYCRSLHGSFYDCNKKRKLSRDQLKLTFTIKQPGSREQGAGSREQGAGSREPGSQEAGSREQGAGSREQGAREPGSREQGAGSREQGAGSREQGAGSQGARKQGAGSREQGAAGSREQGAREPGSREQGAGSREQGAGSSRIKIATIAIPIVAI